MIKSYHFYLVAVNKNDNEIEIQVEHLMLNENETLNDGKKRIESEKNFLNHDVRQTTKEEWTNWKSRNPESKGFVNKWL